MGMLCHMPMHNVTEQLAEAARELRSEDVAQTLERAIELALHLLDGCEGAGVSLVRPDKSLKTPAATAEWVSQVDALQYELQEGPCIDAVWNRELIHCSDLATEERWPAWGHRVAQQLGVRSMLCLQLFVDQETVGGLSLYSKQVGAFADETEHYEAHALAAHVALALVAAQEIEHLHTAIGNRTLIGQAQGILMERFGLDAQQAFAVLQHVSMNSNTKLFTVAAELVGARQLPSVPKPGTVDGPGAGRSTRKA